MAIDTLHIILMILLVSGASVTILGTVVYAHNQSYRIAIFFLLTLITAMWIMAVVGRYYSLSQDLILPFARLTFATATFVSALINYFAYLYPRIYKRHGHFFLVNFIIATIIAISTIFTSFTIQDIAFINGTQIDHYGIGYYIFNAYFIANSVLAIYFLVTKIKKATNKERTQIAILIWAVAVSMAVGFILNVVFPFLSSTTYTGRFGPIVVLAFIILTAYAISKYKLFSIKIIATEFTIFLLMIFLLVRAILSTSTQELILNGIILGLGIILGVILIKSILKEVQIRQKTQAINNSLRALRDITYKITRSLDFSEVTQELVDEVTSRLKYQGALVLTVGKDKKTVKAVTVSDTPTFKNALKILPKKFDEFTGSVLDGSKSAKILLTGKIQKSSKLSDFVSPALNPKMAQKMQQKLGIHSLIGVPVTTEDVVKGVLIFGLAKPVDKILDREIQTMKSLGDQLGIVTRNIDIIKELKRLDQAKSDFLSIASHQLRTPITATKGYISMILEGDFGKVPPTTKKALDKVFIANNRLINLINDLLNVSRIEKGRMLYHMMPQDIGQIIQEVVEVIAPQAKQRGLKLNVDIPKNLPQVMADKEKLRQMIMNLTDNSIKYTKKGHIDLSITKDPESHTLLYSVKDTGMGIAKKDLPHLFKRFSRGTNASVLNTEGTGLGLYVAKQIATAHHANVWAESEGKGKGAQIYMEMPYLSKKRAK